MNPFIVFSLAGLTNYFLCFPKCALCQLAICLFLTLIKPVNLDYWHLFFFYAPHYAFTTLTNQDWNNIIFHWLSQYLVENQCSYHIQDISCYIWLLQFLIISSQSLITTHTSLHKRPALEITICSNNLISPWATMTANENMAYILSRMQLNWVLGLSMVAVLLWLGTLPSQVSSVPHLFASTSPSCRVSSSVDLVLILFQRWILPTCPVIQCLATIFKIFYITFMFPAELHYHFQLYL